MKISMKKEQIKSGPRPCALCVLKDEKMKFSLLCGRRHPIMNQSCRMYYNLEHSVHVRYVQVHINVIFHPKTRVRNLDGLGGTF